MDADTGDRHDATDAGDNACDDVINMAKGYTRDKATGKFVKVHKHIFHPISFKNSMMEIHEQMCRCGFKLGYTIKRG